VRLFVQTLVDGTSLGCLYALVALGIAMIFGIMGLINFAHGDLIAIAGFTFYFVYPRTDAVLGIGSAIVASVAAALIMERVAFRPVRNAPPTTLFVTSLAVSFLLESIGDLTVGSAARSVALPLGLSGYFGVGGIRIGNITVAIIGMTVVIVASLTYFLRRTSTGVQMRAAAEDFQMARILGVPANRVIALAFAISGFLAAIVALALVAQSGFVDTTMGQEPVLIGFVATVLGGLGSLAASGVGGFALGFIAASVQAALPVSFSPFGNALVFVVVIAILVLRPQGLVVARTQVQRV
jgi:branched-chain amino acid transport system permease protein